MQEYYFPSGMPVTAFDAWPWIKALEIFFALLLLGALGVFAWRSNRPAVWTDILGWTLFAGVVWLIAWGATRYFQSVQDRFSWWQVWTPVLWWTFGLALFAMNVTAIRDVGHNGYSSAFLLLELLAVLWLMMTPGGHPREASWRVQCKSNLQWIGLAMHNYHDTWKAFPPAGEVTTEGTVCSWRVAILPWVDQLPLYQNYHRDEPWDSPHNATLQTKNPPTYVCPSHVADRRFTAYAMLRGPHTIGGDGMTGVSMKEITDGTSNTFLAVESCGRDILWTEPKDIEVTDNSLGVNLPGPHPGRSRGMLASYHPGGAHALVADGVVRMVNEKIDPKVLRILATRDGGEMAPRDW